MFNSLDRVVKSRYEELLRDADRQRLIRKAIRQTKKGRA